MKKSLSVFGCAALIAAMPITSVWADNSGFQIAPPPIAHPVFEAGVKDQKFEPLYVNIRSVQSDVEFTGFGFNYIGREAYNEHFAASFQFAMLAMTGTMPGFALPVYYQNNWLMPTVQGQADVSIISMPLSANLEIQVLKQQQASLIVFLGPNLGVSVMTMQTPYTLSPTSPTYTNQFQISTTTAGLQFGMQAGIGLSEHVSISPFFMMSSSGGSSTVTYKAGAKDVPDQSYSGEVPDTTSVSFGMDIIIGQLSVGTVLQSIQNSDQDEFETVMMRFGYRF